MTADPATTHIAVPGFLAHGPAARVLAALPGSRAVGGCVRDTLAGRPVHDVDVGVPMPPEEAAARLREAGLKVFETGLQHGTVTAVADHVPVEVTSLRRDLATDGRHAEVAWTTDWRVDAERRDFTINAMSMNADGALWDYFGGRDDLAAGRVRFVGDAAQRLAEDYLRALRFFRFQARYGAGAPDPAALAAIRAAVPGLARLSAERVWMELKRLLEAPDPCDAIDLMAATGVLKAVLPEVHRGHVILRALVALGAPADPLLRFSVLAWGAAADAARRLKASGEEIRRLAWRNGAQPAFTASDDELRQALVLHGKQALTDLSWRCQAQDLVEAAEPDFFWPPAQPSPAHAAALPARFRARVAEMPVPQFPLQGRDGLALGLQAGPGLGRALAQVREWWMAGGCRASAEDCRDQLRQLAERGGV